MTPSEKREIVNELRRELIEVMKAINGFQRRAQRLLEIGGKPKPTGYVPGTMPEMMP